ncbi:unnamed protein product [Menidia menidia]|uniref:(Atlantic silverside) hypothetical protein n=1 Tax=Menidia menidia TaxID=238744 RepID=A0A8S4AMD7_9TELE|nr:unnamed protein product [Menidia menidia]
MSRPNIEFSHFIVKGANRMLTLPVFPTLHVPRRQRGRRGGEHQGGFRPRGTVRHGTARQTGGSPAVRPHRNESPWISPTRALRSGAEEKIMATLGPESARPSLAQLGSSPSIQTHVGCGNLPPNRGLERALEEAAASGVLNLSCRKLKEFPRTAANHDLSDTTEAADPGALIHACERPSSAHPLALWIHNTEIYYGFTMFRFGDDWCKLICLDVQEISRDSARILTSRLRARVSSF